MYFVYAIQSEKDQRLYIGMSHEVEQRIKAHNAGYVFSTKGWRPWKLVYQEFVGNGPEARNREKFLKSGSGKEFLKKHLAEVAQW